MKTKKMLFVIVLAFHSLIANAQFIEDARRYSSQSLEGTARYVSMGGAFSALGGDISSITDNPAAAAVLITFIWMIEVSTTTADNSKWIGLIALPVLSFLMISNITYYSFKDFNIRHKVPHIFLFVIALVISFISFDPPLVLFSFFILYASSGPSMYILRFLKKKKTFTQEKKVTKP